MTRAKRGQEGVEMLLRSLRLPSFVAHHRDVSATAEKQSWTFEQYLYHLAEMELADRHRRRIQRQLKQSRLPGEKTLALLEIDRFPTKVRRQLSKLCTGEFVEQAENVLAFGLPGRGKTHLVCAIGHELTQQGHAVYFTPTYKLVQRLLAAKRDLTLEKELRRLPSDNYTSRPH